MDLEDYIEDALAMVSAWEIPEQDFAQVVNEQARLTAGFELELSSDPPAQSPYASLRF
jgi:hypothetical protein